MKKRDPEKRPGPTQRPNEEERERERDKFDPRELELVRERAKRFNPERWVKALEQKRRMSAPGRLDHDPGPLEVDAVDLKSGAAFLSDDGRSAKVEPTENPDPKASFGFVGGAFAVAGDRAVKGTLVVRLDDKLRDRVGVDTVRLFRWDGAAKRFEKVARSGVGGHGSYVWGRVTRSGIYVPIGLPSHPLLLQTVRLWCVTGDLMSVAARADRDRIRDRICQVILCAPDFAQALEDPAFVRDIERFGAQQGYPPPPPGWAEPGGGRNPCEECLDTQAPLLPECELLPPVGGGGGGCLDTGWVSVGPRNVGGCALQVAVDPTHPDRIYAAASDGGIWRLDNVPGYPTSSAWRPLTDQQDSLTTAAIAVAEFDGRILYYADGLGRLMRSDDRGFTWRATSTTSHGVARRILVHPSDPDTVFVAGENGFRGSPDGGANWTTLLSGDALDAAIDPEDSSVLFVGIRRDGLHKSYTAGAAWRKVLDWSAATTPGNTMIKIAVGSQGTEPTRTVAVRFADEVFINRKGGRGPAMTGGGPWTSRGNVGFSQGDWDHVIAVDPFNDDVILSGGTQLFRSPDGGQNWTRVIDYYNPHEDQQSLAFDPVNTGVVYVANDGGIYRSADGGATWIIITPSYDQNREFRDRRDLNNGFITAQFYHVGVNGDRAVGNLYHSGIWGTHVLSTSLWEGVEGHAWEFANVHGDPKRPAVFYVFTGGGLARRLFPAPGGVPAFHGITPANPPADLIPPACLAVDTRANSGILLVGTGNPGRVMRTRDADFMTFVGNNLSPPMAWVAEPGISLPTDAVTAVEFASPSVPGQAYAASAAGRVFRKLDVSTANPWEERTNCGIAGVREIAVGAGSADRLYVINEQRVRFSEDGGQTWGDRHGTGTDTLPNSELNSVVTHPSDAEIVFVGADIGVFASTDEGQHWQPFDDQLPNAQILQIFWQDGWLYAVTYGRGLWRRRPCF